MARQSVFLLSTVVAFATACSPQGQQSFQASQTESPALKSTQAIPEYAGWLRADQFSQLNLPAEQIRCGELNPDTPPTLKVAADGKLALLQANPAFTQLLASPYLITKNEMQVDYTLSPAGVTPTKYVRATQAQIDQAQAEQQNCLAKLESDIAADTLPETDVAFENRSVFEKEMIKQAISQKAAELREKGDWNAFGGRFSFITSILAAGITRLNLETATKNLVENSAQLEKLKGVLAHLSPAEVDDALKELTKQVRVNKIEIKAFKAMQYAVVALAVVSGMIYTKGRSEQYYAQNPTEKFNFTKRAIELVQMPNSVYRKHIAQSPEDQALMHNMYLLLGEKTN